MHLAKPIELYHTQCETQCNLWTFINNTTNIGSLIVTNVPHYCKMLTRYSRLLSCHGFRQKGLVVSQFWTLAARNQCQQRRAPSADSREAFTPRLSPAFFLATQVFLTLHLLMASSLCLCISSLWVSVSIPQISLFIKTSVTWDLSPS